MKGGCSDNGCFDGQWNMKLYRRISEAWTPIRQKAQQVNPSFWGRMWIYCDFFLCKLIFRCNREEYFDYEFYKYQNAYRKDFLLKRHRGQRCYAMNPRRFSMHKKVVYELVHRGIQRDILYLWEADEAEFLSFVRKHRRVITKPDVGSLGWHVQLFEYVSDEQALAFYYSLTEKTVCEEYIRQHEKMQALNPGTVNSVRLVTLNDDGDVRYIGASLKMGAAADAVVDNMHRGGLGAGIDTDTGVVMGKGRSYAGENYMYHPVTGVQIAGFAIPFWQESLDLVHTLHRDIPQCPYLGWDIAITPEGPEIIEINSLPGPKLIQLFDQKPKGQYLKAYVRKHRIKKARKE